jgi:hypothetical protein
MNKANKVQVIMDSTDAGKIVEVELTRDHCEGVYAMCEVLGRVFGEMQQDNMKSGMAAVLRQIPKGYDGIVEVPFTAETAASVLSLCCFAAKTQPTGAHMNWLTPLRDSIERALSQSGVHCQILVDTVPVFVSP